jgi:hypothetical protein
MKKVYLRMDDKISDDMSKIQRFVYRCQSYFYDRPNIPFNLKDDLMKTWLHNVFTNVSAMYSYQDNSAHNIIQLTVTGGRTHLDFCSVLIDFNEPKVGVVKFMDSNGLWEDVNIFEVVYEFEREDLITIK